VSLPDDKTVLRARLRALRRELAGRWPGAAEAAAALFPLEAFPSLTIVAGYHPLGAELDPQPLMARLAACGVRLALPAAADREAPLTFRAWTSGQATAPDAFGVPSPTESAAVVAPDLVIAPVLAFDAKGRRLGQGGGTYDRTLANLRGRGVFSL